MRKDVRVTFCAKVLTINISTEMYLGLMELQYNEKSIPAIILSNLFTALGAMHPAILTCLSRSTVVFILYVTLYVNLPILYLTNACT